MNATPAHPVIPLQAFAPAQLKEELAVAQAPAPQEGDALRAKAEDAVRQLLAINPTDLEEKRGGTTAVETMGADLQIAATRRSKMLQQTIGKLGESAADGGPVAQSLMQLQGKVEELDPNRFDFSTHWLRRAIGALPFVGTPAARYFSRYQSAESVIGNIVTSLETGRDQLKRDIVTLEDDQQHLAQVSQALQQTIGFAQIVDRLLTAKVENEMVADDPRTAFVKEEILFPLRQRIMDLQQQLLVTQQGVLTLEVIKRNNKELIRGVSRALGVTVNALQIAVTLALGLANQRIVLEKIEVVNKTTDQLIGENAARLRTQGAEIHKQAASAQLSIEVLKQAFGDINAAIADIARFRQEALPAMAQSILEMDTMTQEAAKTVAKMAEAKEVEKHYGLEVPGEEDWRWTR
jgi:uncharacterized protein YaaN involved in tellurite resistance